MSEFRVAIHSILSLFFFLLYNPNKCSRGVALLFSVSRVEFVLLNQGRQTIDCLDMKIFCLMSNRLKCYHVVSDWQINYEYSRKGGDTNSYS